MKPSNDFRVDFVLAGLLGVCGLICKFASVSFDASSSDSNEPTPCLGDSNERRGDGGTVCLRCWTTAAADAAVVVDDDTVGGLLEAEVVEEEEVAAFNLR